MRKIVALILLALIFQLSLVAGFDPASMNPQSKVHSTHVGPGTVGLNCDICHGFPPKYPIQVDQNATSPGHYIVCENCHATPPDSMKPSMGNLIVIHLSRGLYCTNCHDTTKITPAHPSTKAENGTVQVIKCENCHANPQNSISHVNGGKYCLDCHGDKTAAYIAPTTTPLVIPVSPTPAVQAYSARKITVKLDTYRGFLPVTQTIKAGDEIIWENNGAETITLVSSDGLFEAKLLSYGERASHIFVKPGTYVFYLNEYKNLKGTITVESIPSSTFIPGTPVSTTPMSLQTPVKTGDIKKRAQLQVTYEVGAWRTREELTISVHLKNIGNVTASKVNLTIENPPELQASVLSGSEQVGNIITWRGEIEPGKEHAAQYAVKIVTGRTIEVPLKVTYAKLSQEEKARELGIAASEVNAAISPEEIELITLVMKIGLSAIPGFETAAAIAVFSAVYLSRRKGRRVCQSYVEN